MTSERSYIHRIISKAISLSVTVAALLMTAQILFAQSSDQSLPTAVLGNEITGTIAALDIGDPRLTRYFYAFEATPGDLIVTVNSRNLNGDVDIFTAVTFRPLTKISIYANTIPPEVTKSLYFRTRQILILRVEARTPNDDPGTYHITFGGSFQPFSGGIAVAENVETSSEETTAGGRKTKRLSSVGATIEQPAEEEKTEAAKASENVTETPAKEETEAKKPEPKPKPTRSSARGTTRTRTPRTSRPKSAPAETAKSDTSKAKTPKAKTAKTKSEETKSPAEGEEKSGEPAPPATPPVQEPAGPHLIIEQKDGTLIDRPMSTIRRVIVEGGVIVVVSKNGRVERIPMSNVARMAIQP